MERFKIGCAVHLILIKDGKILLQRRNNPDKYGNGKLGMPSGHIEDNENVYGTLKREMKEELGINVTSSKIVQVMNIHGELGTYDCYFFTCEYEGELKNIEKENSAYIEWVDLNSDLNDLIPYQKYALSKYLEGKDNYFTLYGWDNIVE